MALWDATPDYDVPKDYRDWIGFRQVIFIQVKRYKYMTSFDGYWE